MEERKYLDLQVKSAGNLGDEGNGYLEGYGAVKGNIDSYGDVIRDGAFKNLEALVGKGFAGKGHDWTDAIGYVEEAREDEHGLWVKMAFHSTSDAQDVRTKVQERLSAGKAVGLSIGYFTKAASPGKVEGQDVRFLDEIEVFEVSVVTMPANERATVLSAKGHGEPRAKQFDNLTAQVQDYIHRLQEIKSTGASDERVQRFTDELSAVAALCLDAIDELSAKTEAEPEFDSFPDGWEATLARAQQLIN
jgi:HK97 family phage prohead protease